MFKPGIEPRLIFAFTKRKNRIMKKLIKNCQSGAQTQDAMVLMHSFNHWVVQPLLCQGCLIINIYL